MKHSPFLTTTTEALRRVFIPTIRPIPTAFPTSYRSPLRPLEQNTHRHNSSRPQAGAFNLAGRFVSASKSNSRSTAPLRPIDEAIRTSRIHIVQPDNKLGPPEPLIRLLRDIDRKTHFIEQHDGLDGIPVCKIVNKAEARAAEKERRKAKAKNPSLTTKYLELNWAIDQNDLAHRLGKLRQFLMQGRRVEVFLAKKKKRMRDATEDEGRATLESVRECVKAVEGAQETRSMEGQFLGRATLFYEGKRAKEKAVERNGKVENEGKVVKRGNEGKDTVQALDQEDVVEEDDRPRQAAYG